MKLLFEPMWYKFNNSHIKIGLGVRNKNVYSNGNFITVLCIYYSLAVQTAELFTYEDENVASTFIPVGDGSDDILLCHYGNYLKTMHFKNNQGFKREYIVSLSIYVC